MTNNIYAMRIINFITIDFGAKFTDNPFSSIYYKEFLFWYNVSDFKRTPSVVGFKRLRKRH